MNSIEQLREIVITIHTLGKTKAPSSFPNLNTKSEEEFVEFVNTWAEALQSKPYPRQVWIEAVDYWIDHIDTGRMISTGELKKAAAKVWDKYRNHPDYKPLFEARRDQLRDERDQQIKDGTFGLLRGYGKREIQAKSDTPMTFEQILQSRPIHKQIG